jgi:hypothetical protein
VGKSGLSVRLAHDKYTPCCKDAGVLGVEGTRDDLGGVALKQPDVGGGNVAADSAAGVCKSEECSR